MGIYRLKAALPLVKVQSKSSFSIPYLRPKYKSNVLHNTLAIVLLWHLHAWVGIIQLHNTALLFCLLKIPGRLVDALKKYEVIFYLAGSEVVLSALFLAIASYCCLSREKRKTPQPEDPPAGGGGSETEEAESDLAEGEDHPGDNHHLPHSLNNAGADAVNHIVENRNVDGSGRPEGEGEAFIPSGCNIDHTVERNSF